MTQGLQDAVEAFGPFTILIANSDYSAICGNCGADVPSTASTPKCVNCKTKWRFMAGREGSGYTDKALAQLYESPDMFPDRAFVGIAEGTAGKGITSFTRVTVTGHALQIMLNDKRPSAFVGMLVVLSVLTAVVSVVAYLKDEVSLLYPLVSCPLAAVVSLAYISSFWSYRRLYRRLMRI